MFRGDHDHHNHNCDHHNHNPHHKNQPSDCSEVTRPAEASRSRCTRQFSTKATATRGSGSGETKTFQDHRHQHHVILFSVVGGREHDDDDDDDDDNNDDHDDLAQCGGGSRQPSRQHGHLCQVYFPRGSGCTAGKPVGRLVKQL